jgi:hypothetical protein
MIDRIACHTVGIAVEKNTGVGTGTLVATADAHLVITAAHVIKDADVQNIRFWCRPDAPIREKTARDVTREEMGRLTAGEIFPIEAIVSDDGADIAAIKIASSFKLPKPSQFYLVAASNVFANWSESELDGLSLLYFGFPVANSQSLRQVGDRAFRYIGCAHGISSYDRSLNHDVWKNLTLSSFYSPEKDFFLKYSFSRENIDPEGFSGCGVWIGNASGGSIWSAEPLMIGMIHSYLPRKILLAAAKMLRILQICREVAKYSPSESGIFSTGSS